MSSDNSYCPRIIIVLVALLLSYTAISSAQEKEQLPTSVPGVILISPEQHSIVRPGQEVPVHLEIDESLKANSALIMGNLFRTGISLEMNGPPFLGILKIPNNLSGPVELSVMIQSSSEKIVGGFGLNLNVVPDKVPQKIYTSTHAYLGIPPANYIPSRTIFVKGIYDNGKDPKIERDISDISTGTTYRSSDTNVFTIDEKGEMQPVAPGSAFVIVKHRGLKAFVAIDVRDNKEKNRRFPGVDHTSDVTITASSPRQKQGTVRYVMDVKIRNNAELPLHLPLRLVISDLADGVRVADARKTTRVKPVGSPYVYVDVDEQAFLSPGKSARAKVEFINFDKKPLNHQLRLFAGGDL